MWPFGGAQPAMRSWGFLRTSGSAPKEAAAPPRRDRLKQTAANPPLRLRVSGLDSMAPAMIYSRLIRYGKSVSPLIMHWTRC